MKRQHDMTASVDHSGPAASTASPASPPRIVRVHVGKHFNLSVSLTVSPAFVSVLALGLGLAGGNYWFLQ